MANKDAPRGAWPIKHLTGGTLRTSEHTIASGYAENIFTGDFVVLVAGGGVQVGGASERLLGVFSGVSYVDAAGKQVFSRYWPSGTVATEINATVFDDPNILFGIQSAGSTVAADVGNLGDIVAGAGSTSTGQSGFELNGTTSTAAAQCRVIGKVAAPDNDWGTNVDLIVQIFEHEYAEHSQSTPGV